MASKDVTSFSSSFRFFLPLILIFLIAAGSAFACPEHRSNAAYRTRAINTRTVSHMTPVVITYGNRASYQGCADNAYGTRRVKYVSVRDNGYYEGGARYVAVRNIVPRPRYVAARDYDLDYAPRYVAVRRQPVYADYGTRYVAVRSYVQPRTRLVAVRNIDYDYDTPRYVAVRTVAPGGRYVAVRNVDYDYDTPRYVAVRSYAPRTRYVAVRDVETGCSRVVARRSCLDDVETAGMTRVAYRDDNAYSNGMRHVVVKTDYIDGTEEVIVPRSSYDESAYVDLPDASVSSTRYVSYNDNDDVDSDHQDVMYNDDVTYVADDDMETSCLPRSVAYSSPNVVRMRSVSYVSTDDDDDLLGGDDAAYVAVDDAAPPIRFVSSVDDVDFDNTDSAYVSYDDVDEECIGRMAARTCDKDLTFSRVNYVPVENVSYMPVESVRYVPADDPVVQRVVYVIDESDNDVEFSDDEDACDRVVSSYGGEPDSLVNESASLESDYDSDMESSLENVDYSGDSREHFTAINGYEDETDASYYVRHDPYIEDHTAEFQSFDGFA